MGVRAKRLAYAVTVDSAGAVSAERGDPVVPPAEWTPEHMLLAALVRCSLTSLRYHARRSDLDAGGGGSATGIVTKPSDDGRYALLEVECRLEVWIQPPPAGDALGDLLAKTERDCFVGASLRAEPVYRWHVNGRDEP